jgi:myo-inositol-1(or 4)-monophosphatase
VILKPPFRVGGLASAIVHAAGVAWKALDEAVIFPLVVGEDYGSRPYPTLVVARSGLLEVFGPLVAAIPNSKIID